MDKYFDPQDPISQSPLIVSLKITGVQDLCTKIYGAGWIAIEKTCQYKKYISQMSQSFLSLACQELNGICEINPASVLNPVSTNFYDYGYTGISILLSEEECNSLNAPWIFEQNVCMQKMGNEKLTSNKNLTNAICDSLGAHFTFKWTSTQNGGSAACNPTISQQ